MRKATQEELRDFVNREVLCCVSGVVSRLCEVSEEDREEFMDLFVRYGHHYQNSVHVGADGRILCETCSDIAVDAGEIVGGEMGGDECAADAVCADCDDSVSEQNDDPDEIYEHWAVTDWFARKLKAHGESVADDFYGLTVWGRGCTGQAIYMDNVIEDIWNELHADDKEPA